MSFTTTIKAAPAPQAAAAPSVNQTPSSPKMSARDRAMAVLLQNSQNPASQHATPPVTADPTPAVEQKLTTNEGGTKPTPEATAVQEPSPQTPSTQDQPLSAQYAALARKEKALRLQAQQLKAEREAFKRDQDTRQTPVQQQSFDPNKYISIEDLQANPALAFEKGLTYDQFTQAALNAPSPEQLQLQQTIRALEAKIESLTQEQSQTKKTIQDTQEQGYQQALNQIRNETKALVADGETFEMIKATNSVNDVVDLIERTWKEEQRLMTVEEAAQMVEDYLVEESLKLYKVGKIQKRLQPAQPQTPAPAATQTEAPKQPQAKTLTNATSGAPRMTARQRAEAAFYGKQTT